MLWVPLDKVQDDMTLGAPTAPANDEVADMLEAGEQITPDLIAQLRATGVGHVWIDDPCGGHERISYNPTVTPAMDAVTKLIRRVFGNVRRGAIPPAMLRDLVDGLDSLERRMFRESGPLQLADRVHATPHDEAEHAANVTYIALGLALRASDLIHDERRHASKQQRDNLSTLALAAALHDIGKVATAGPPIRAHILTAADDDLSYQHHVTRGAELLGDYRDKLVSKIMQHHHLRRDGLGFPAETNTPRPGAKGHHPPAIHVFSRIVGLADVVERLREQHPGPLAMAFVHTRLLANHQTWFDRQMMTIFKAALPPFYPGILVPQKDGSLAAIDQVRPDKPLSAKLQTVFSPDGQFIPADRRKRSLFDAEKAFADDAAPADQTLIHS